MAIKLSLTAHVIVSHFLQSNFEILTPLSPCSLVLLFVLHRQEFLSLRFVWRISFSSFVLKWVIIGCQTTGSCLFFVMKRFNAAIERPSLEILLVTVEFYLIFLAYHSSFVILSQQYCFYHRNFQLLQLYQRSLVCPIFLQFHLNLLRKWNFVETSFFMEQSQSQWLVIMCQHVLLLLTLLLLTAYYTD